MNAIITDLIDDHKRFRILLMHYEHEVEALRTGSEPDYSILNDLARYFSLFPDELHHKKEDIIYDVLVNNEDDRATSPSQGNARLHDLRADHETISNNATTFREGMTQVLAGGQLPRDQLSHYGASYIMTLRRHMKHEEEAFFPRAVAVISENQWARINARFSDLLADDINIDKVREVLAVEKSLFEQLAS